MHAVDERLLLVQALGVTTGNRRLAYAVTQAESERAREWIARNVPGTGRRLVGLQPFSFPTKAHRDWPMENFVELAARIVRRDAGAIMIILGDEVAAERAGGFVNAFPENCVVAAGQLSLRQSAALMQQLSLYVGVDTGPTHIAGALDMPMVALYHPAYPGRNLAPLDRTRLIAIEHPATGAADRASVASADMGAIPVEQVWAAVRELLSLAP
jgi:heptosyltransferase-3